MSNVTAEAVKALRERTGLPMMDCKKALVESEGNQDKAVDMLRERGAQVLAKRSDRDTDFGRMGIFSNDSVGAMVELKCESAPVASHEEFIQLANDLAQQLATGPGASSADELLDQPSPSKDGMTLREQKDDLFNRIREVFNVGRIVKLEGPCGGYSHNAGTVSGVLVRTNIAAAEDAVKDICMHVAAMRPQALSTDNLDPSVVQKEREILAAAARQEGKPDNIIEKMVEGRLRNFYAEQVLLEQPFVKEPKISVVQYAKDKGFEVAEFVHWELGS